MNVAGVDPQILFLYRISDVSGVLLMGMIGGTIARQRGFDIVGFLFIALFSSLGGGMIRDVLINEGTVAAMAEPEYLILAFTGALIARFVYFKGRVWELVQVHGDAVVSALWAATGCVKALSFGLPILSCVMMGVFTAVGGGMIRDVTTGQVPGVFGNNMPTVIPAIAATGVVLGFNAVDQLAIGMIVGPIVSFVLTMTGYWAGWRLHADAEWAPVTAAAGKVERGSRKVAREIEPRRIRAWRHRQMEAALQRRVERQRTEAPDRLETDSGQLTEVEAAELRSEVEAEADQLQWEQSGFGVDFSGDSYDTEDDEAAESVSDGGAFEDSDTGWSGDTTNRRLVEELIDVVLADDSLMDELLGRVERKQRREQENVGDDDA